MFAAAYRQRLFPTTTRHMAGCAAMLRRSTLLICLLALALPLAAHAQSSTSPQLPPLLPSQQPQTLTVPDNIPPTSDDGLPTWQQILLFGSGGILLFGIAWLIVRNARDVAPRIVTDDQLESRERREADLKRRKTKNRAAAKRSRAARRRNR
jgi:hypothetical protein